MCRLESAYHQRYMNFLQCNGIRLAYVEQGQGTPAIVLLHGCGLDHSSLSAQMRTLAEQHRVVSLDLRGHGFSVAPVARYDMETLADDVACVCAQLDIDTPVIVGHSMGGNVALSFSHRHPDLVSAILLIDSALFIPEQQKDELRSQFSSFLTTAQGVSFFKEALRRMCLPSDVRSQQIIENLNIAPHVLLSALPEHTVDYNSEAVVSECRIPLGYIHSNMPFVDLDAFRRACPQLIAGQTFGAGHLSPQEVPDQVNAMISRFLENVI